MSDDKYRWHDLRKNPEDLPENYKWVLTVGKYKSVDGMIDRYEISNYHNNSIGWTNWLFTPYAWKEIEPFEEET